jgi:hypothetical protein
MTERPLQGSDSVGWGYGGGVECVPGDADPAVRITSTAVAHVLELVITLNLAVLPSIKA